MNDKNFQQQVNDLAPYSQINKAFRHTYGVNAAAVLATLIYKYTYWGKNNKLIPTKTKSGNTLHYFYISKLDISIDSRASISSLEKDNKNNPLNILEELKLIERKGLYKANKADRFVLFPNRIKAEISRVSKLFKEDLEMKKKLSPKYQRDFFKALRGKMTRDEVYAKFEEKIEGDELNLDDFEDVWENPASIEARNSSNEGRTKNSTKNINKNNTNFTNPSSSNRADSFEYATNTISPEKLKYGLIDFGAKDIDEQEIFNLLINYFPDQKAAHWVMSKKDKNYIEHNIKCMTPEYVNATIDYIDINIERMIEGPRDMRFGSLLAGIYEKVFNASIGVEPIKLNDVQYQKSINNEPEEQSFDFVDDL